MKLFILMSAFVLTAPALAGSHSLTSDTTLGQDYFYEGLGYQGRTLNASDSEWKWSAGYALSQSTTESSGTKITDKTHDFSGGGGWRGWKAFDLGLNFAVSTTPSEGLSSSGGTLSLAYTFRFKPSTPARAADAAQGDDKNEEPESQSSSFNPYFGIGIETGRTAYTQGPPPTKRKSGKIQIPSIAIQQTLKSLEIFGSPWEWLYIKLGTSIYSYDRDVATFVNNLESLAPLAGITGAASGFLSKSTEWSASFYPWDDWTLGFSGSTGTNAADGTKSKDLKLKVGWDLTETWEIGAGVQKYTSSGLTQTALIFNLGYHF